MGKSALSPPRREKKRCSRPQRTQRPDPRRAHSPPHPQTYLLGLLGARGDLALVLLGAGILAAGVRACRRLGDGAEKAPDVALLGAAPHLSLSLASLFVEDLLRAYDVEEAVQIVVKWVW